MFKKTILTISALAFSVGLLVASSPNAEAGKKTSRYKLNKMITINVSNSMAKYLCKIYSCTGGGGTNTGQGFKYYKFKIRLNGGDTFIAVAGKNGKYWWRGKRYGSGTWKRLAKVTKTYIKATNGKFFPVIRYYQTAKGKNSAPHSRRKSRYIPTRFAKRACLRHRKCRAAMYRHARKYAGKRSRKARYIPTRYKRKMLAKKRRALKRRRALRRSRYNVTRYKRKAAAKRRAMKRRRILRKRRALRRSKYKRTSYRGRRHLRRRAR